MVKSSGLDALPYSSSSVSGGLIAASRRSNSACVGLRMESTVSVDGPAGRLTCAGLPAASAAAAAALAATLALRLLEPRRAGGDFVDHAHGNLS